MLVMGLFVISCDETIGPDEIVPDEQDSTGNLLIMNDSGSQLALYAGEDQVKIIPNSSEDYLVKIPNPSNATMDLMIYKVTSGEIESDVYKRWNVILASDYELEHRSTWHVTGSIEENTSGTLSFSYVGGTDYNVDIFLNGQTGAKLISLGPGQSGRQVGVDYGNYTLHYRYWNSDQNSPDGMEILGWTETEMVLDSEVNIFAILNAQRPEIFIQLPHWTGEGPIENQYGNLTIINSVAEPVSVYAGGVLIEQVMYTDEPTDNMSTIASGDMVNYVLPIGEYTLIARSLMYGTQLAYATVTIEVDGFVSWEILGN